MFSGKEAPFYRLFERGGTILLGKLGRRLVEISLFMSITMLEVDWISFYGPWRAGHLNQVILLVWPKCSDFKSELVSGG